MGLFDIGERIKNFVKGEISAEKKNAAFDQIQQSTGVPIDEKQRLAILKANVDPELLLAGFTIKQMKDAAGSGRGSNVLNQLQQPGAFQELQQQLPGGGSVSQGGVTATIPPSPEMELQKEQRKADIEVETAEKKKIAEINTKRADLKKELDGFFLIDDQIERTEGGFRNRVMQGIKNKVAGIDQSTAEGFANATHDAVRKRLRVKLVRAAGDVGNMNIVEQLAAEQIIPSPWDAEGTAKLKRAFLSEASKAIEKGGSESEIKKVLQSFAQSEAFRGPKGKEAEKLTKSFKVGDTVDVKGKKYKVVGGSPNDPDVEPLNA